MNDSLSLLILVGIGLVLLSALSAFLARSNTPTDFPYLATVALLTPAERSFFGVLQQALAPDYHLFAKVRLADILDVQPGLVSARRSAAFNRISAKHADFVACDPKTFRILGVIELDDRSHRAGKRRQRDEFVDSALAAASIPILRVAAQRSYSPSALREQVEAAFRPKPLPTSPDNSAAAPAAS